MNKCIFFEDRRAEKENSKKQAVGDSALEIIGKAHWNRYLCFLFRLQVLPGLEGLHLTP